MPSSTFSKIFGLIVAVWLVACGAEFSSGANRFSDSTKSRIDSCHTEFIISTKYARTLLIDGKYVFSFPVRWHKSNWLEFSIKTVTVGSSILLLDGPMRDFIQRNRSHTTDDISVFFEPFGRQYPTGISTGFYLTGLLLKNQPAQQVGLDAIAANFLTTEIISPGLKMIFGRSRPYQNRGTHHFRPFGGAESLPSGHSTQAFTLATVVASHYRQTWVKILAYGTATMVAYARLDYNEHFLSDVTAGAFVGMAVGKAVVHFNMGRRCKSIR